jgi:hypothetical protein
MKPALIVLVALTIPVVVAGGVCAVTYHDVSMFYVSLAGAVAMLVVLPLVCALMELVSRTSSILLQAVARIFRKGEQ